MNLDQAHEQNNPFEKGVGGAIGLQDSPSALRRWMLAGPDISKLIKEIEKFACDLSNTTQIVSGALSFESIVYDSAALVHILKPDAVATFLDYSRIVFQDHIRRKVDVWILSGITSV